ncbi:MAG: ribosome recycling factor [Candidatus Marinimicrobia bacterium]|nr:ribosome recycling factor [Candidatus Neomarinimicrobiota bacterium]
MINEIKKDAKHRMDQAITHTLSELAKIRTGRANPDLLNSVKVDYYGTPTPLNQIANISVPEPRLLTVQPWEKNLLAVIERAILNHNLGLTPSNNGQIILCPIPALSEERRKDLIRVVHQLVEEGRIAIRNVRKDVMHHLKTFQKEENISEDEIKRSEDEIQTMTDEHVKRFGEIQTKKEEEMMEV